MDGGAGPDSLLNKGSGILLISFVGGGDADAFTNQGFAAQVISFSGDEGDDIFTNDAPGAVASIEADGGPGEDVLALRASVATATFRGGAGDDRLHVAANGSLTVAGGAGSDEYFFVGLPAAQVSIEEAAAADQDKLNFSNYKGGALGIDLEVLAWQDATPGGGLSLKFDHASSIEDVIGTTFADTVLGNVRDNTLRGAEFTSGRGETPTAYNGRVQWVLLEFAAFTDTGEHVYSQAERDQVQARLEEDYHGPGGAADPWFHVYFTQDVAGLPSGIGSDYATIRFNNTPAFGRAGGFASELDFRNLHLGGTADVQVNGMVGGQDFRSPSARTLSLSRQRSPRTSWDTCSASGTRTHLARWATALHSPPGLEDYKPAFTGPSAAFESFDHLGSSPASIGSDRFNDLRNLYFGEREAIKLVYAERGATVSESLSAHNQQTSSQPLSLSQLAVPNTLAGGATRARSFSWGRRMSSARSAWTPSATAKAIGIPFKAARATCLRSPSSRPGCRETSATCKRSTQCCVCMIPSGSSCRITLASPKTTTSSSRRIQPD